jgi:hypothetical protein
MSANGQRVVLLFGITRSVPQRPRRSSRMSGDTKQRSRSFETWWRVAAAAWVAALVAVVAACLVAAGPA